jgi:hypothetical protein
VIDEGQRIVLRGTREFYTAGCQPTGRFVQDTLVFTFSWSD